MYNEFFRSEKDRKDIINKVNVGGLHSKLNKSIYDNTNNISKTKEILEDMYSQKLLDIQVKGFLRKIKNNKLDLKEFIMEYKQFGEFGFMDFYG